MMPLPVKLQHAVKATKHEAMTITEAAEYLNIPKDKVYQLVDQAIDLKMIGEETIIAKRDKINTWITAGIVALLFWIISILPGYL
ncbi:excisionase family DNA-binding protein [Bacillus amyloliquefaciens]|uniref:excisionase family DNA-binding protein n=1 Tax=Bacillus amyloliquefaciens TaxID=1390 RepID=UPI003A8AD26E